CVRKAGLRVLSRPLRNVREAGGGGDAAPANSFSRRARPAVAMERRAVDSSNGSMSSLRFVFTIASVVTLLLPGGVRWFLAPNLIRPTEASSSSPDRAPTSAVVPGGPVDIEMKNVHLHSNQGVVLDVAYLRGQMLTRTKGQPPVFDDAN